jgi:hypothetical protein
MTRPSARRARLLRRARTPEMSAPIRLRGAIPLRLTCRKRASADSGALCSPAPSVPWRCTNPGMQNAEPSSASPRDSVVPRAVQFA